MPSGDQDEPASELGRAETVTPELADTASPETAPEAESRIGGRPEADRLARAVARTRIGNKLFAKDEQVHLGRYHLLELVGSGGMGVVWGAWDPQLERRVAIKLVKATIPAARDRIQLEGQALARLSHPNVVTVHDVGVVDDQIYIVMEWVRGQNLRAWCRAPRTLREIVALYRAAGEGLAAAHAAGLIHRDFKPDNAIRGDDGRVRVLDFGLARGDLRSADDGEPASSELTRGAGTPRYMPPEQAQGRALGPAVDQYALCVSLREALAGRTADGKDADIPRWLEAIIARGTAPEPGDRFASMTELLRALARDPATIWRRRVIAGGALAATAVAFAVGNLRASSSAIEPCTGAPLEIARAWSPAARAQLVGHLQTLGPYGAGEAARLDGELGGYTERWAASHRAACLASERGELTPQIYERNLGCLARARVSLETVLDLLSRVPGERLSNAVVAARGLPDTERCLTQTQAQAIEPPPRELAARANALGNQVARLRVLATASDPSVAATAEALVAQAEQLGYQPLIARAQLLQGHDLIVRGELGKALPVLERAAALALDTGDDPLFVEAYARELFAIATTPRESLPETAAAAIGAIPYVERIAHRLGTAAAFERALLFNNIGVSRMSAGDRQGARAWFDKAIAEPSTRDGGVELVSALGNLALVDDDPARRERLLVRERDTLAQLVGDNHILTLEAGIQGSMFAERPDAAAQRLRDACQRVQRYHATEAAALISRCAYELGWLADERGDAAETRSAMQLVADNHKPIALAYLAAADGKLDDALGQARRAAAGLQSEWWNRFYAGDALLLAAVCADRLHRRSDAIAGLRAALAIYDQLTMIKQAPYHQRRVARTQALLARLVAPSDPAEARALAGAAATWYRAAGGYDAIAAEMAALASRR